MTARVQVSVPTHATSSGQAPRHHPVSARGERRKRERRGAEPEQEWEREPRGRGPALVQPRPEQVPQEPEGAALPQGRARRPPGQAPRRREQALELGPELVLERAKVRAPALEPLSRGRAQALGA
jgi:hypothetical protein